MLRPPPAPLRFTLLLAVVLALVPRAEARATPIPPDKIGGPGDYFGYVNGKFLILNMHGGLHHPDIEPVRENVRYAAWMNAGVIRIFATDSDQHSSADGERVGHRIGDLASTLREHGIKLIVALVNNHQEVAGENPASVGWKDGYWQLLLPFYTDTWRGPYLDFSRRLIRTVLDRGARDVIFAWEFGNELHSPDDPPAVLTFMVQMAAEIRAIDATTPIFPGTMGALHVDPENYNTQMGRRLYCEAPIDAYTLHGYDWLDPDRWGDMPIHWDLNYVINQPCPNGRRLPVIVEELGTSRHLGNVWGPDDEERRFQQELHQLRMVLRHERVVGVGSWSSESPLTSPRRHDNRRGLTSFGPGRDGHDSCYPAASWMSPGYRCRLEQVLRNLPALP